MPRPSDPAAPGVDLCELLADAERHLRVGDPAVLAHAVTRSHLADGRCVGWYGPVPPGTAVVLDAEIARPVPPALARRHGAADFWRRWTRAECLCKLADVPMLAWWSRHGMSVPGDFAGAWRTLRYADLVITVAAAPVQDAADSATLSSTTTPATIGPTRPSAGEVGCGRGGGPPMITQ